LRERSLQIRTSLDGTSSSSGGVIGTKLKAMFKRHILKPEWSWVVTVGYPDPVYRPTRQIPYPSHLYYLDASSCFSAKCLIWFVIRCICAEISSIRSHLLDTLQSFQS